VANYLKEVIMSILENPEILKQQVIDIRNLNMPLSVYRCEYVMYPEGHDYDRRTAYVLAENQEIAAKLIQNTIKKGVRFDWENRPGFVANIHGITPTLEKAWYLKLKEKYEPNLLTKVKNLRGKK
jgi:hypothetical protein